MQWQRQRQTSSLCQWQWWQQHQQRMWLDGERCYRGEYGEVETSLHGQPRRQAVAVAVAAAEAASQRVSRVEAERHRASRGGGGVEAETGRPPQLETDSLEGRTAVLRLPSSHCRPLAVCEGAPCRCRCRPHRAVSCRRALSRSVEGWNGGTAAKRSHRRQLCGCCWPLACACATLHESEPIGTGRSAPDRQRDWTTHCQPSELRAQAQRRRQQALHRITVD